MQNVPHDNELCTHLTNLPNLHDSVHEYGSIKTKESTKAVTEQSGSFATYCKIMRLDEDTFFTGCQVHVRGSYWPLFTIMLLL